MFNKTHTSTNHLNYNIKIFNLCKAKDSISKGKIQGTDWDTNYL